MQMAGRTVRNRGFCRGGIVVVVVVVLALTRRIKPVVTRQAPVTLELRNTPGKEHKRAKGGTRVSHS